MTSRRVSRRLVIVDLELQRSIEDPAASQCAFRRVPSPRDAEAVDDPFRSPIANFARIAGSACGWRFHASAKVAFCPASQVLQGTLLVLASAAASSSPSEISRSMDNRRVRSNFSVAHDATIEGVATLGLNAISYSQSRSSGRSISAAFLVRPSSALRPIQVAISNARLTHDGKPLVAAQASIRQPYEPNPQVACRDRRVQGRLERHSRIAARAQAGSAETGRRLCGSVKSGKSRSKKPRSMRRWPRWRACRWRRSSLSSRSTRPSANSVSLTPAERTVARCHRAPACKFSSRKRRCRSYREARPSEIPNSMTSMRRSI